MTKRRDDLPVPYEREVQKSVLMCLRALGCRPMRRGIRNDPVSLPDGSARRKKDGKLVYARSEESGEPDVTATIPGLGTRLEVEVKRPGGRPTKLQYECLRAVIAVGAIGVWTDDVAWLAWAVGHFKLGARAGLDAKGESFVYYPDRGHAGRVAWVLKLDERTYQCLLTTGSTPTSSSAPNAS